MGSSDPQQAGPGPGQASARRSCPGCGTVLASDNTARLCSKCHREQLDQLRIPPQPRTEFFETDEFRAAFESQYIGRVFKAYRNHPRHFQLFGKALNQEHLGRWLGLTQAQVSKLENGRPEQNLDVLQRYAEILHLPRHMLWFDLPGESRLARTASVAEQVDSSRSPAAHDWRDSSFEKIARTNGRDSGAELVMLAAWESTRFGLRHQVAEIHDSTMEQIEAEARRLSVDFVSDDPFATFARSRQLRNECFSLLERRALPSQEALLYGFAARACGYLAAASSDFYGRYDAAADQIRTARRFADVSGFRELRSWVLALESGIAFWHGNPLQAASLAERSLELAVTRSGVMRATAMRARALARLGDLEGLRAAIAAADSSGVDDRSDDESGMILFSEANHIRCIGTANLWVGESRQAQDQLAQALRAYLSDSPGNFAVIGAIRADLARSFLSQRDVSGAAESLIPLLDFVPGHRLEGVYRRLRDLRSLLQTSDYSDSSAARELSRQIEDFLAQATSNRATPEEL